MDIIPIINKPIQTLLMICLRLYICKIQGDTPTIRKQAQVCSCMSSSFDLGSQQLHRNLANGNARKQNMFDHYNNKLQTEPLISIYSDKGCNKM